MTRLCNLGRLVTKNGKLRDLEAKKNLAIVCSEILCSYAVIMSKPVPGVYSILTKAANTQI